MESISVGVDIGSAAIKVVVLSQQGQLMHSAYVPHHYRVRETLRILWRQLMAKVCEGALHLAFTGKGAAEFSSALQIPFVDEVQAETEALRRFHPEVDVAVSLGGEDARMMYFERMVRWISEQIGNVQVGRERFWHIWRRSSVWISRR